MKRYFANIIWLIFSIPFYAIMLISCLYTTYMLDIIHKRICSKTTPFRWMARMDEQIHKIANKISKL